jgi:glycosyltransferase involved in cell wall biosynthesis
MAASFVAGKRQQVLLVAAKRLVQQGAVFEIWFAGSGPLEAEARRRAQRLNLDKVVRFYGYVPNKQILEWLACGRVDVVVLASEAEGVPVSLVEALAHEIPAVASDVGGVRELLGDGCGLLVPPEDPQALADALAPLLSSGELRARYARAGRERVTREFAVAAVVERLRVLFGFT